MLSQVKILELSRECASKVGLIKSDNSSLLSSDDIKVSQLCSLWGGMGHIYKITLSSGLSGGEGGGGSTFSFVIKHVTPPPRNRQSFGDQRKAKSYIIEAKFYESIASNFKNNTIAVIPEPFHVAYGPGEEEITICMSLLEGRYFSGYDKSQVEGAIRWLAQFHATFWGAEKVDKLQLQPTGGYWHLDTRPDEHQSMRRHGLEGRLKTAARAISEALKRDPMQCLIHGDVKDANILTLNESGSSNNVAVGMYDFQYCGKGPPTRDLAYFFCTACSEVYEKELLEYYHETLTSNLKQIHPSVVPPTLGHLKLSLEVAFCDFYRFICAWGIWGNDISERVDLFLEKLDHGKELGSELAYDHEIKRICW
jgi:hypothetical protein